MDEDDDDEFLRLSAFDSHDDDGSGSKSGGSLSAAHEAAHSACKLVLPLLLHKGCTDRLPTVNLSPTPPASFIDNYIYNQNIIIYIFLYIFVLNTQFFIVYMTWHKFNLFSIFK